MNELLAELDKAGGSLGSFKFCLLRGSPWCFATGLGSLGWAPDMLKGRFHNVRERRFALGSLFELRTGPRKWLAVVGVALSLVGVWQASLVAGGSRTVLPHLFYVPVILGAVRFGWIGAVVSATIAGLLYL